MVSVVLFVVMVLTILSKDVRISQARSGFSLDKPSSTADYFEKWMTKFSRVYANESEKQMRFEIFKKSLKYVEDFNSQGNHSFTVGINAFSDLTHEEFAATHLMKVTIPSPNRNINDGYGYSATDWRVQGAVTRVRNQGDICRRKPMPTKLKSSISPGTVLTILAGTFKGARFVFLKQLPSGLLLVSGPINVCVSVPFMINNLRLRCVKQAFVSGTSTKFDISGVNIEKKKKGEGELFEAEKEEKEDEDQKTVDAALIKSIEDVADLKTYLRARFSLKQGMKHLTLLFHKFQEYPLF